MELLLSKFCQEHENWEKLLSERPYKIKINKDGQYAIFSYTMGETDFSYPLCLECRGTILDMEDNFNPVCVPFYKFFNSDEPFAAEIDWDSAYALDKIDGSLIKIWSHNGKFHISTNGTIDAYKAKCENPFNKEISFGSLVKETLYKYFEDLEYYNLDYVENTLLDGNTHMFELTSPYNQIVVDYGQKPRLTYLGSRNLKTGKEYYANILFFTFPSPKVYTIYTLEEAKEICSKMTDLTKEGFVIVDQYYNRVKVKSPAYVYAHHCLSTIGSMNGIIDIIKSGEIEEICAYCKKYEDLIRLTDKRLHNIAETMQDLYSINTRGISCRKDLAENLKDNKEYAFIIFKMYNNRELDVYKFILSQPNKRIISLLEYFFGSAA